MNLTDDLHETPLGWPGPLSVPASSGWPDWARRCGNALRAMAVSAVAAHRARASRMKLRQELAHLDDHMLRDIGVQPSAFRCVQRVDLGPSLPIPWR